MPSASNRQTAIFLSSDLARIDHRVGRLRARGAAEAASAASTTEATRATEPRCDDPTCTDVVLACAHVPALGGARVHGGRVLVRATVRVQPESVYVGQHLRPIAIVHAQVTSAYFLFLAIPGHVDLDHVVNRMLSPAAKLLGADKVVDIKVDITPDTACGCCASCSAGARPRRAESRSWSSRNRCRDARGRAAGGHQVGYTRRRGCFRASPDPGRRQGRCRSQHRRRGDRRPARARRARRRCCSRPTRTIASVATSISRRSARPSRSSRRTCGRSTRTRPRRSPSTA